jgi:hypothetical protein
MSDKVDIFEIPQISKEEANALQACWAGEATEGQQHLALAVVIDKLSMADFLPYQQEGFGDTSFLSGRAFVGKALRRTLKIKIGETQ